MIKLSSFKENLLAFGLACFLAAGILLLINGTQMFQADVLNGKSDTNIDASEGNLSYEFQNGKYTVYTQQEFQNVTSLSLVVSYDPTVIQSIEDIIDAYNYNYTFGDKGEGRVKIYITGLSELNKGTPVITFETNQNQPVLNFSNIKAQFSDGEMDSLTITQK